jgi:hypothetical protein
MLEVADSVGPGGLLRLRRHGQRLDGRGAVIHVFVCGDWRDAQAADPHCALRQPAAGAGPRHDDHREARRPLPVGLGNGGRGLRLGRDVDLQRIDPDGLGNVLELGRAEIVDSEIEPPPDLPIGLLGKTDCAGLGDSLQSRGDVDAVTHQIAVAFPDHVAQMDADAKLDAALGRHAGVALGHAVLNFDGAAHRLDHAAKFDERAVAGALDDASAMRGDGGIDQIAAQPPKA